MKLRFTRDYRYAFGGKDVVSYKQNQEIETDSEDLIKNSIECGAAVEVRATIEKSESVKADLKPKKLRKTPVKC